MNTTLLLIAGLIMLGIVVLVLRRSWGDSLSGRSAGRTVSVPRSVEEDAEFQRLMAAGLKIQAIKRVRELSGVGLREAKEFVEAFDRGAILSKPAQLWATADTFAPAAAIPQDIENEVLQLLLGRQKIAAIKRVQQRTGMGLKEAKEYVESLE